MSGVIHTLVEFSRLYVLLHSNSNLQILLLGGREVDTRASVVSLAPLAKQPRSIARSDTVMEACLSNLLFAVEDKQNRHHHGT